MLLAGFLYDNLQWLESLAPKGPVSKGMGSPELCTRLCTRYLACNLCMHKMLELHVQAVSHHHMDTTVTALQPTAIALRLAARRRHMDWTPDQVH